MTIDDKISDEKMKYHINREAAKISAIFSDKIDEYNFLTGEVMLPSNQSRMIEQDASTTYSPSLKHLKSNKTIEEQEIK